MTLLFCFFVLSICIVGIYFFYGAEMKNSKFKKEMQNKLSGIRDNGEFEGIYNQIINTCDMGEVKREHKKKFSKTFLIYALLFAPLLLAFIVPILQVANLIEIEIDFLTPLIVLCYILVIPISLFSRKKGSNYKNEIIKNLVLAIDSNIKYDEMVDRDKDYKEQIYQELYMEAAYKDQNNNRRYITDYMEYQLDSDSYVKMADLHLMSRGSESTTEIFEGMTVKIERNGNCGGEILVQRNTFFKGKTRINDENNKKFEKYFDLYARDMNNANMVINQDVKNGLVSLYEEYGIMFEVSLYENNMYIRFFTGGLFEMKDMALVVANKEKLYREYIIFKTILTLIRRINELIPPNC